MSNHTHWTQFPTQIQIAGLLYGVKLTEINRMWYRKA